MTYPLKGVAARIRAVITLGMMAALAAIVALTFCDVLGRHLFGRPVFGAHDITEHLMALIIFLGLPLISLEGGHLTVDLFDRYLLRHALWPWHLAVAALMAALLLFLAWVMWQAAAEARQFKEVSQALNIPRDGLYGFFSISAGLSALAVLVQSWEATAGRLARAGYPGQSNEGAQ